MAPTRRCPVEPWRSSQNACRPRWYRCIVAAGCLRLLWTARFHHLCCLRDWFARWGPAPATGRAMGRGTATQSASATPPGSGSRLLRPRIGGRHFGFQKPSDAWPRSGFSAGAGQGVARRHSHADHVWVAGRIGSGADSSCRQVSAWLFSRGYVVERSKAFRRIAQCGAGGKPSEVPRLVPVRGCAKGQE